MNVLIIWDADYPWDIRIEKMSNSLISNGHEVHMVCRNKKNQSRYELYEGIHLHRIFSFPAKFKKINGAITFPAFFSPIWISELIKQTKQNKCDIIIVRDLPMALAGILVSKLLKIPIILDMAECYPAMLETIQENEGFSFKNYFVRNVSLAKLVEKYSLRFVDGVFVMVDESRDYLLKKGVREELITIVSNTPVPGKIVKNIDDKKDNISPLRLIYIGELSPYRGIENIIRVVAESQRNNIEIHLNIIGTGFGESALKDLVRQLELEKQVNFLGWINNSELLPHLKECDVGVVPHHVNEHTNTTIPNKLFDYMAAGKAVLVSDAAPMKRIVNEVECGECFSDNNLQSLHLALDKLGDPKTLNRYGMNGLYAVHNKYNWSFDEKRMISAIDGISG